MFQHFGKWLGSNNSSSDAEHKLREISLEYDEAELIASTHNFDPVRRLGAGNYGAVYRGTLRDGHDVAVKVMEVDEDDDDGTSGFVDEVRVLSKFRHPNLVTLMGWGRGKGRQFLVYELLDGGDVSHRLQSCRAADGEAFGWIERLWIALDAACGLSHMHNSTPKAFHRDIKSANILLDRSGTAKMADFGLSGIAKNKGKLNMTCEQISGTPGYACPHYIKSGRVTEGTEVYAFGMVVMELLLNSMPACLGHSGNIIYPIFQVVMPQAAGALERTLAALDPKAGWPPALAKDLSELALACSDIDEARRPNFTDVARRLRQLCEQFCSGKRPNQLAVHQPSASAKPTNPPTNPQICSQMVHKGGEQVTRPQLGGLPTPGPGTNQPTRPQLGLSHAPGPAVDLPTRPQISPGPQICPGPQTGLAHVPNSAVSAAPATRRQMGVGVSAVPGVDPPTRPQLGLPHMPGPVVDPPTRPQMSLAHAPSAGNSASANPQLSAVHPSRAYGVDSMVHDRRVGPAAEINLQGYPRAPHGLSPQKCIGIVHSRGFDEAMKELWADGLELAFEGQASVNPAACAVGTSPTDLAEAVLECLYSSGIDVNSMTLKQKSLVLGTGDGPWTVGRQQQPNLFARLVPDEALRTVISRNHLLFTLEKDTLCLKKLSPNAMLLNGQSIQQQELALSHGAQIGFCGQDNVTAFLVFSVLLREPATAAVQATWQYPQKASHVSRTDVHQAKGMPSVQQPILSQQPPTWWFAGPPTPFLLVCVLAFGYDVTAQPLQARTVGLSAESRLTLGRLHQPGFFEGILGAEPAQRYLCCVSRSHLELVAVAGAPSGFFDVTNLSANPVALAGQRRLGKGERGAVGPGDCVDFIGGSAGASGGPVIYLKLRLEEGQRATAPPLGAEHEALLAPPQLPQAPPVPASVLPVAETSLPPPPPRPCAPPLLPAPEEVAAPRSPRLRFVPPPFRLMLRGSAVRADFTQERRQLEGCDDGLTVGRAHQQALHAEAFEVELRQYLSRDHFRIERSRDGACRLVPLSSNPMWRLRGGRQTEAVRGDPALPLVHGDAIQIFTGAEDCTPDGSGNMGSLFWIFQDTSGPLDQDVALASERGLEPPSCGMGGQFERCGVPHALQLSSREGSRSARERSTSLRRQAEDTQPGSQGCSSKARALQAPVDGLNMEEEHHIERRSPLDVDLSYRDVNDKFAASGFRY